MSERRESIFKGYLSCCQRGAEVQSISEKKLCLTGTLNIPSKVLKEIKEQDP